jgi:hypothetical protein
VADAGLAVAAAAAAAAGGAGGLSVVTAAAGLAVAAFCAGGGVLLVCVREDVHRRDVRLNYTRDPCSKRYEKCEFSGLLRAIKATFYAGGYDRKNHIEGTIRKHQHGTAHEEYTAPPRTWGAPAVAAALSPLLGSGPDTGPCIQGCSLMSASLMRECGSGTRILPSKSLAVDG